MYFLEVDHGSDEDDELNENPGEDGDAEKRVEEYHVDGFRFDLASVLCRGTDGSPLSTPPLVKGVPHQPDHIQCGFYVMRFMRDIIYDQDQSFVTKWDKRNKLCYTQGDMDVLRNEWAKFIIEKYL